MFYHDTIGTATSTDIEYRLARQRSQLTGIADRIQDGLPQEAAEVWPEAFKDAIRNESDLSLVVWKFLRWLLTDADVNPGISGYYVQQAVRKCADVLLPLTLGIPIDEIAALEALCAAKRAALETAKIANKATEKTHLPEWNENIASAARGAECAAWCAESALTVARSNDRTTYPGRADAFAASAVESAAWSAAHSANAITAGWNLEWSEAWIQAERAAYVKMGAKLIDLIQEAGR